MARDYGLPGMRADRTATPRKLLISQQGMLVLPRGRTINGSLSRDPLNTGDLDMLRSGMLMGMITASGKFAPSVIGVLPSAHTSSGTSVTSMSIGAANAVELVRRIGDSGTFKLTGPPSAAGTVAETTVTYSAVNQTTGIVTITDIAVNKIAGSFIQPTDGSETPLGLLLSEYGIKVTDKDSANQDSQLDSLLVAGIVDSSQIINWQTDTSLAAYVKAWLRAKGGGWVFDDDFSV